MLKNKTLKGVLLVGLGASSYGMLATFVKMAYDEGFTTAEISGSQFLLGLFALIIINLFRKKKSSSEEIQISKHQIRRLVLAGTSIGLTSVFYYLSVKYVPVSISIVLLMQTVWMGVILEMLIERKRPSIQKTIAVLLTLFGTVLATNLLQDKIIIEWKGVFWGLLAAASYTLNLFSSNKVATEISSLQRSLYMLVGGLLIILFFGFLTQQTPFDGSIFIKWGLVLSLFGTVIPPILFNTGFPLTGLGLGSIVSALELPVSVMMAYFLLSENVNWVQWLGISIILIAIMFMKIRLKK